jgi:hypothetical protein
VGDWRAIYTLQDAIMVVVVLRIASKRFLFLFFKKEILPCFA